MIELCINPISANRQYFRLEHVELSVAQMISCLKYVWHALRCRKVRLIYDDRIEARGLLHDGPGIISEINRLSNGDTRKLWFLFTKNHAARAQPNTYRVVVSSGAQPEAEGDIGEDLFRSESKWLSFSGMVLFEQRRLYVVSGDLRAGVSIENAFDLNGFQPLWPRYEPSEKHRKTGYYRDGGEWVSPMPLDEQAAQDVLMTSAPDGNNRYAFHKGEYYRFPRTHFDQEVFHGFLISRNDVPAALLAEIEAV